jgi:hypothetical protein
MPSEREALVRLRQKVREGVVDLIVPERRFKKELDTEIEQCLDYFKNPWIIKGIGITIGRLGQSGRKGEVLAVARGEPRGYFWERNGERHIVGREVMTRKQKDYVVKAIHRITFPYAEKIASEKNL